MMITDSIHYIGVNDHAIDLFEGQYVVPNGMAYNSYLIQDEKNCVMDTVDIHFKDEWLQNLSKALHGAKPDYLVVQHMEPDHSANILNFLEAYPDTTVVTSAQALKMMSQFFTLPASMKTQIVKEGDTLSLGTHTLHFVGAPMVHWPEVLMTYDDCDKVLFTADGFGKFGALDVQEDWADEARRYYFGIVGKFGMQVQNVLKKAGTLDIQTICPLHGPVLKENLSYYLNLYNTWSSYTPEEEGVTIAYSSVYGHTKEAALCLESLLKEKGCTVATYDLARCDMSEAVESAFRYSKLVLASITYNAGIFPHMETFIHNLTERAYQNRTIGLIENGSWAPIANKIMKGMFATSKNITFAEKEVTIHSAMKEEDKENLRTLAEELQ